MSTPNRRRAVRRLRRSVPLFAALGDDARLSLLVKLSDGSSHSITQLSEGASVTRQAIRKHLHVLERVQLVRSFRQGRENLFQLNSGPLMEARDSLDLISQQWDEALSQLKSFVEDRGQSGRSAR